MSYMEAIFGGKDLPALISDMFNEFSAQSGMEAGWADGRSVDMAAFDQLPRPIRDYINEHGSFYPIEDVLYDHINDHGGDYELTLVYLLESAELGQRLEREQLAA